MEAIMTAAPPAAYELIADPSGLAEVVDHLRTVDRYALDTEFHREKTYWPHVALVQIAWPATESAPGGLALVDALAVDLHPLAEILDGPATLIAHAAEQDLEVLTRSCGTVPGRLWDTQVAAGFAGLGSASLATLSAKYLGIDVAKGDRLTDWSARPLTASQLAYAAADVEHLIELSDAISADLEARGRTEWAEPRSWRASRRRHQARVRSGGVAAFALSTSHSCSAHSVRPLASRSAEMASDSSIRCSTSAAA
jgi:ribonuclease D